MSVFQDIRAISPDMATQDLLRFLIAERFPGKTIVTASLKAPSVVVLKMVADIDPATPVVFCARGYRFPESQVHRERIVELLGLSNVSLSEGGELDVQPGDHDHCESMWAESEHGTGRSYEIVHLNQTLAPLRLLDLGGLSRPRPAGGAAPGRRGRPADPGRSPGALVQGRSARLHAPARAALPSARPAPEARRAGRRRDPAAGLSFLGALAPPNRRCDRRAPFPSPSCPTPGRSATG